MANRIDNFLNENNCNVTDAVRLFIVLYGFVALMKNKTILFWHPQCHKWPAHLWYASPFCWKMMVHRWRCCNPCMGAIHKTNYSGKTSIVIKKNFIFRFLCSDGHLIYWSDLRARAFYTLLFIPTASSFICMKLQNAMNLNLLKHKISKTYVCTVHIPKGIYYTLKYCTDINFSNCIHKFDCNNSL